MPARKDFTAEQGAQFKRTLTWSVGGTPVDLTGYSAKMQVRQAYGAASTLLDLNTTSGGIALGGTAGTITITATATEMAGITVPNTPGVPPQLFAVYDLVLTDPSGNPIRKLEGQFIISRQVSV